MALTNINKIYVGWITNFGKEYNKVMMAILNKNMDMEETIFEWSIPVHRHCYRYDGPFQNNYLKPKLQNIQIFTGFGFRELAI